MPHPLVSLVEPTIIENVVDVAAAVGSFRGGDERFELRFALGEFPDALQRLRA